MAIKKNKIAEYAEYLHLAELLGLEEDIFIVNYSKQFFLNDILRHAYTFITWDM